MDLIISMTVLIVVFLVYFLPSIIAKKRRHKNYDPILLINIFLGWTFIGWFVALVWSVAS